MIEKKTWDEFRNLGLLWFVNRTLHLLGWAICVEFNDKSKKEIINVYPARCKFRGFSSDIETKGFINVSKYLKENIDEIAKEANE